VRGSRYATLLVTYEDHAASTIVPRLIAAGADLTRVHVVDAKDGGVSLPGDIDEIAQGVRRYDAKLLIVDPVVAALPADINSHRDQDVRAVLAPLRKLAEEQNLAILGLIHWNKAPGVDALTRVGGSTAFTAGPRSVLAFGPEPDEPDGTGRVLAHVKCNVAPLAPSLACRVEGRELRDENGETIATSRLVIGAESDVSASDFLTSITSEERSELDDAVGFLRDELDDDEWHPRADVVSAARRDGIAKRTLERAFKKLRGISERHGFPSCASWRLPVAPTPLGATENDATWRDCESPVTTRDSATSPPDLRQAPILGATETSSAPDAEPDP
jgi:hypothetical protein